jgi:murein DD-endopeptidase MepM/ murein hydrolase activator NlpD
MVLKTLAVTLALVLTGCATGPFIMTDHGDSPGPYAAAGVKHRGIDIAANMGTPVRAAHDGVVRWVETRSDAQWIHPEVVVQHTDSVYIFYYHIDRVQVQLGDTVKQGQVIAYTARTGKMLPNQPGVYTSRPHLHMETRDPSRNVFDPKTLNWSCPGQGGSWWWPVGC